MRIGIDIRLQSESGVGRYISNLVKHLPELDKQNEYVLVNPKVGWHSLSEQIFMPSILFKEKLDLVHFPYFNVPVFYLGKFVVTIHDLTIGHFDTGRASMLNPILYRVKRIGYKFVLWNAVKRATKIIVPTNAVKNDILHNYKVNPQKIAVIYEGVDRKLKGKSEKLKISVKNPKLGLLNRRRYLLYVGNAYPHKNLNKLILAFKKFTTFRTYDRMSQMSLKLVFVGRKDYFYQKIRDKVRKQGLTDKVVFTGYVSDAELKWLYQNAIALVMPSLMEGFGLPALEAMQSGCLVLASDIPALREVCQEAAVYFNAVSIEDMTYRMKDVVYNQRKYQKKVKLGKKRANQFSWTKMVKETVKVYESCVSLRPNK